MGSAGAALCGTAALLAAPELYVAGIALLLGATIAPAWVLLATWGCEVRLSTDTTTVPEGERARLTVTVSRRWLPVPGSAQLSCPGWETPPARVGRCAEIVVSAIVASRGRHSVGPARLQISDPFGICVQDVRSCELEVLGLPSLHAVSSRAAGPFDRYSLGARDVALEFDSLRPSRGNAPASRIHWPTVARSGVLMERSLIAEADPRVLVVLDAHLPLSEKALDQALRATASLCVHLASLGGCALMLPDDRGPCSIGPDLRGWPALHARLAVVRSGAPPPRERYLDRSRTLLYVTAAGDASVPPGGYGWRVGPHPLPDRPVTFTVAGCSGQRCAGAGRSLVPS